MARLLPVSIQQAKEQAQNFFIELYTIQLKTGELRIAACDQDITFNGKQYLALPIERGAIKRGVDNKIDTCEIRIGNVDQSMTLALFQGFDFRGCKCYIHRILYPDSLQDASLIVPVFSGILDSPYLNNKEFKVTILAQVPNQQCPNRKCQLTCNAKFADPEECGVVKVIRTGTANPDLSTKNHIYDTARLGEPENYWKDGIITIGYESRRIKQSKDGYIYLEYPFILQPTGSYIIEQGCDKTFKTCKERYNNGRNFSGFLAVPFEYIVKS